MNSLILEVYVVHISVENVNTVATLYLNSVKNSSKVPILTRTIRTSHDITNLDCNYVGKRLCTLTYFVAYLTLPASQTV
jgi:hypothetical protein